MISIVPEILLLQGAGKSLTWTKVALECLGFLPYFAIFGALGFHFLVLPHKGLTAADEAGGVFSNADRVAARTGLKVIWLVRQDGLSHSD